MGERKTPGEPSVGIYKISLTAEIREDFLKQNPPHHPVTYVKVPSYFVFKGTRIKDFFCCIPLVIICAS